ncbi:NAD-dependent epimerase/dehydratase family protein [Parapedobacter sp. ISTM3]|uniref:NAD-dependent epimerase/dehydratase family protein n=1 Tax=Parapedobacter sp. ISTM3 TaxID=2800130 RepID=UPI0019073BF5|nr:NAD-dependent epimerase/dehydratase family protein [Parapedobacter sp. ISTM3]MBK1441387.1 NAD-dependent epimerase/dehydratase family protein [Parapedobacter sp. ISTM3]
MEERIIIIGSNGQIGTELAIALRAKFGGKQVITSDIREPQVPDPSGPFETIDVLDKKSLHLLFTKYRPTQVYLLAAMLSATGEKYPRQAWDLNVNGLLNVLDLSLEYGVSKVFWPSSIAVFGPHSPKMNTPQYTVMDPNTVYGISKLAGERICEYYHGRYGLDIRSIRYPGIISWKAAPGGGTTDYAIHIFHEALKNGTYSCFLSADTALPMLYMDDAIRGTLTLMDAPADALHIRSSYNLTGVSFTPAMLADEIRNIIPEFTITYAENDPRQAIADTWPNSIDDTEAREDWDWQPRFALTDIAVDMITNLKEKIHSEDGKSI